MSRLNEKWSAYVVGLMHYLRITNAELAKRCGITPSYLSMILNGKKKFETLDSKARIRNRIYFTLKSMEKEIMEDIGNGNND